MEKLVASIITADSLLDKTEVKWTAKQAYNRAQLSWMDLLILVAISFKFWNTEDTIKKNDVSYWF